MAVDPSVIAAIEAAVVLDTDNVALRTHLCGLLADAGRYEDALLQATEALQREPDNLAALRVAATSADAIGAVDRARSYRRLLDALSDEGPHVEPSNGLPGGASDIGEHVPDTAEEMLAQWNSTPAPAEPTIGELSRPSLRLADVGGMSEVKHRLDLSFLAPLRNPQLREQFGKSLRGGLLLWGPPGCGKTYLARALAGELGVGFYEIGLNDVLDMWIGSSERNLHAVFDVARAHAPCVLFFDEIDALGHKRSNLRGGGSTMRGVVNQFLVELDGASTDNADVFVLGASNHPWDVDPALLRPGRFDRRLFVAPPDLPARETILRLHLRDKPTERLDLDKVAKLTEGLSGADLALICDHATEQAMEDSLKTGVLRPLSQRQLLDGVRSTRGSVRSWLEAARNYVQFANSAGEYDELAEYLKHHKL